MKIAFKNFLTTLKRYKVASMLNVLGLTLAFVAFYIIASQVYYTLTYNSTLKDADRTYLISPNFGGDKNDIKQIVCKGSSFCYVPVFVLFHVSSCYFFSEDFNI